MLTGGATAAAVALASSAAVLADGAAAAAVASAPWVAVLTDGGAHRWRSRRSSCMSFSRGCAHRWRTPCILGIDSFDGCEGTSCRSEACSRPWWSARYADALHLLLSCSAALQMHQMSLTVVMETRVGRRQRWHRERHELEAMLAAVIRTRAKLPVQP
jgi:hypothetical protein